MKPIDINTNTSNTNYTHQTTMVLSTHPDGACEPADNDATGPSHATAPRASTPDVEMTEVADDAGAVEGDEDAGAAEGDEAEVACAARSRLHIETDVVVRGPFIVTGSGELAYMP